MKILRTIFNLALVFWGVSTLGANETNPSDSATPAQALDFLQSGHQRFLEGKSLHPRSDAARREATAKGQKPFATILGCSDSRVSLEVLFDQGLGDLFVIRVAGNVADTDEIATVEYGAAHLHTPLVVVLGHTSCGAVTAVVTKAELEGNLPGLLDNIQGPADRSWKFLGSQAKSEDVVSASVKENTLQSMEDLLTRSPVLGELVKSRKVKLVGAIYHLESGAIDWLGPHPQEAQLLAKGLSIERKESPQPTTQSSEGENKSVASSTADPGILVIYVGPGLVVIFIYLMVLLLFVGPKRVFQNLRILGRLLISGFTILFLLAGSLIYTLGMSGPGLPPNLGAFWLTLGLSGLFTVILCVQHVKTMKTFMAQLKTRWISQNSEEE